MDIARLNTNWLTTDKIHTELDEDTLVCQIKLNTEKFEHIDEDDLGILEFYEVFAYRTLAKKDLSPEILAEIGQLEEDHQRGGFFEMVDSNWCETFKPEKYTCLTEVCSDENCHFLVMAGDMVLEVFALDYTFNYQWADVYEDEMLDDSNFTEYLTTFMPAKEKPSRQEFHEHLAMFLELEGDEALEDLKTEIKDIIAQNQQQHFLKVANETEQATITMADLKSMMEVILKY